MVSHKAGQLSVPHKISCAGRNDHFLVVLRLLAEALHEIVDSDALKLELVLELCVSHQGILPKH